MKEIIDTTITDAIKEFNKQFCENIRYPALFGKVKLNGEENVKNSLNAIIDLVSARIYDIESYIVKFPI